MWIYQIRHQRDQLYFVSLVESSLRKNHHVGRSGDQNALKGIPRYCHEYFLEIRTQILLLGLGTASILARYPVVCGSPEGL